MDKLCIQAASNPQLSATPDAGWNERLAAYLAKRALSIANENFGPMRRANDCYNRLAAQIEQKFGRGWRNNAEAMHLMGPTFKRTVAEEEVIASGYYEPQTEALLNLLRYPAPSLATALLKIELIKLEEVENYEPVADTLWPMINTDIARLAS